ncbi:MAG: bifunctional transaldolase/phosoglucose isomerase [Gemmataceae bacterium]
MANPLLEVQKYGQSIWFDNIRRGLIISGELAHMVERDGLTGVTSNPAIFEKAIAGSSDYDQALKALIAMGVETSQDLYERLAIQDIQLAADILYPVYIRTGGRDGYVSLEVSPYLAGDTRATLEEARRLHSDVRRDNLMIKVPATPAGIPAIRQLVAEGISVNATLLFDVAIYEQVADAYMAGLEAYGAKGGEVAKVASVASFFISRIDTLVDAQLEKLLDESNDAERRRKLKPLIGKVAIANARLAYARYRALVASERWQKLAASGAYPQRLLWASTGTKNPRYSRTVYVEELIGPDTVNTIPSETYVAFKEGGKVRPSLTENWAENLDHAREMVQILAEAGLPLQEATASLLADGIARFCEPFDRLLAAVERKRQTQLNAALDPQTFALGEYAPAVTRTLETWRVEGKVRRLWNGDASLWTGTDEGTWLGWLHAPESQLDQQTAHAALAESLRQAGYRHVVVLGMGGSALSPEVFARLFGPAPGCPDMVVLDSIAPAEVLAVASAIEPARTLFIVSSKSGGTVETNALFQFFFERVRRAVGFEKAGGHFLAITDPKTRLHVRAKAERFRHIAFSWPATSGRFASLSNLGMLPASLLGVQTSPLLETTLQMVHSCASCVPPELNPGVRLGVTLGSLARAGRDKLTLILDPVLASFGPWLEQLVSESTGKAGQGIVVIDGEKPGAPGVYGSDRVFVSISLLQSQPPEYRASLDALEKAGHPVIRITMHDKLDLGQEMFRWQMATAVAGAVLGINPFNMPDVEASKVAARARADTWESSGGLPSEQHLAQEGGLSLFADPHNAEALLAASAGSRTVEALLRAHLARLQPGDYLALNAFLPATPQTRAPLTDLRQAIRDRRQVATMLGFSPRLLHSTGQLHKGGPASGLFLQLTADESEDVPIPGQKYTLGALHLAQALGDFDVLAQRGRRLLRIHLGADLAAGLAALRDLTLRLLV